MLIYTSKLRFFSNRMPCQKTAQACENGAGGRWPSASLGVGWMGCIYFVNASHLVAFWLGFGCSPAAFLNEGEVRLRQFWGEGEVRLRRFWGEGEVRLWRFWREGKVCLRRFWGEGEVRLWRFCLEGRLAWGFGANYLYLKDDWSFFNLKFLISIIFVLSRGLIWLKLQTQRWAKKEKEKQNEKVKEPTA